MKYSNLCWKYSIFFTKMTSENTSLAIDIGALRKPYKDKSEAFTEKDLSHKDPIKQFGVWFDDACKVEEIAEPNTMHLATATKDGVPSVRPLLLKDYGTEGFTFYTNYEGRKGKELEENPQAALSFYWEQLKRCVRVEGKVKKISEEESTKYFHSRPVSSQIGSAISAQSTPIPNREYLLQKEKEMTEQYKSTVIPKPSCWGGYVVIPESIEFWQGQTNRIHDRIRFRRPKMGEEPDGLLLHQGENGWVYERLSP